MSLSCYCDDEGEGYYTVENEERVAMTDFRCYGCCKRFPSGTLIRRMVLTEDQTFVDENGEYDYDEEVVIGYQRLCEECGDLYDSLKELGFCLYADLGFIKVAHKEYKDDFGRKI